MKVVSELSDRFGNILFKIATGKYLANQLGVEYEATYMDDGRWPGYMEQLQSFFKVPINIKFGSVCRENYELEQKAGKNLLFERNSMLYTPLDLAELKRSKKDILVTGYRQCPAYWNNDKSFVLDLFRTENDLQIFERIKQLYPDIQDRVSISVRKGDYVKQVNQHNIGFLTEQHYLDCVASFGPEEKFIVTGDDLEWAKTFLTGDRIIFADKKDFPFPYPDYLFDFYLPRLCKHNIIPNSTFSWWSAYLNTTPGRQVLCPHPWARFAGESYDYVPENDNWKIIETKLKPVSLLTQYGTVQDDKSGLVEAIQLRYSTEEGSRVVSFDYSGRKKDSTLVLIPTHKPFEQLNHYEQESFRNTCKVFQYRPVCLLVPEKIKIEGYLKETQGKLFCLRAKSEFFKTEAGYFTFLKCPDIYSILSKHFKYMCLVHLDSWVFRDDLVRFERYGYSYYGAPWYGQTIPGGTVGNGGLCMIKLEDALKKIKNDWDGSEGPNWMDYLGDDIYFGTTDFSEFRVAPVHVALEFAFDDNPEYAIQQTRGRLPMGCHAYYRFGHENFWKQVIPVLNF